MSAAASYHTYALSSLTKIRQDIQSEITDAIAQLSRDHMRADHIMSHIRYLSHLDRSIEKDIMTLLGAMSECQSSSETE